MPCPVWLSIGVERQAVCEELGEIGGTLTKASGEPHHRTQRGGWYHDGSRPLAERIEGDLRDLSIAERVRAED